MAFWKKSEDNGNLGNKIVRPRTGQGYWGARPADEPSSSSVEDPFARPDSEGAQTAGLESKPSTDTPSDAGFKSFAPTAEASASSDDMTATEADELENTSKLDEDGDDVEILREQDAETNNEDDATTLTEEAGDYLEPESGPFVDASADFIDEEDDLSKDVDEANAELTEFTAPESAVSDADISPTAAIEDETTSIASEETSSSDDFNLLADEPDDSFWQDPVDSTFDDVSIATVDNDLLDSDADADIDEIAPEDLIETSEMDTIDVESATPTEDVAWSTEPSQDETPETIENESLQEDQSDKGAASGDLGRWGGPMAAAGAVGGLASATALSSNNTDETEAIESEDGIDHQELTEPAEYADEPVEEATGYNAIDDETAEPINEETDASIDETAGQSDFSAETVEGDGETTTEFDAAEMVAETDNDNVIAWPLSQTDSDESPSDSNDLLTEEERAAIEAVTGDDSVETEDDADVAVATAIPVDKPADFAEEPDEDYNANMIAESSDDLDDDGDAQDNGGAYYYTAAPAESTTATAGGGRRTALYLAGAASLSTICAVGYFLLQNRDSDPTQNSIAASGAVDPTTPAPVAETSGSAATEVETASADAAETAIAEMDFGFLNTTETPTDDTVTVAEEELFTPDSAEAADTETVDPLEPTTRELSGSQTTLASVENGEPAATSDTVVETEVPPKVILPEPAPAPSPKPAEPPTQLAEADVETTPTPTITEPGPVVDTPAAPIVSDPAPAPSVAASSPEPALASAPAPVPAPQSVRSAAPEVASVSQPANLPSFSGDIAPTAAAAWPLEQFEARGSTLNDADKTRFAEIFHRAFETTRDNARTSITTAKGDRASLQFGDSVTQMRAMPIQRAANLSALPDGMTAETGWYSTTQTSSLAAAPSRDASTIARLTPSTAVQKLGVVEQANGDRWYAIGRDGVIVGFVHAEYLTPVSPGAAVEQTLVVPASATLTETINVITPCRDLTMSVGGTSTTGVGCLSPNGQWVVTEAPTDVIAAVAPAPQPAPVVAPSSTTRTNLFAGGVAGIDEEIADILFSPINDRRSRRHSSTITSQRLDALLEQGRSITVARNGDHYSRIRIAPASAQSLQTISDTSTVSSQNCKNAVYVTADTTREITACRQSNGQWRVVSRRGAPYQVRTIASIS